MIAQPIPGTCFNLQTAPDASALFDSHHTLQVLSARLIQSSAIARYRIILSDGKHFISTILATQLNDLVKNEKIRKNTLVSVKTAPLWANDRRVLAIVSVDAIEQASEKIGSPEGLVPGREATNPTASSSIYQTPASPPRPPVPPQAAAPTIATYPIISLSPYQNNWTIKARVLQKGEVKAYSSKKGDGTLFNITLMDETGEIRATAFNEAATALYDQLQEGRVYYISGARVNLAKKQFSHLGHEFELGFHTRTKIEPCHDADVPAIQYSFVSLEDLREQLKDSTCDVIAIVKEVAPITEITSKTTKRQILKRELTLVDKSSFSARLTLWGKQAEQFNSPEAVVAFKSVKVGDYGGRSLSFCSSSTMALNPDILAAHELRGWYDECGKNASYQAHQSTGGGGGAARAISFQRDEIRSIRDVKDSRVGEADSQEPEYFSLRATIVFMRPDSMWYPGCHSCYKKVVEDTDNTWRCEKCDESWPRPKYRYVMAMACLDWSGEAWLQGFNAVGELIFGKTADEMELLWRDDEAVFTSIVREATCKTYNFLCRAKSEEYNNKTRVRYGISRIQPLDYKEEGQALRDLLHSSWGQTYVPPRTVQ
ncbi:hypothetical protein DFH06DRAFT_990079 [Mycena polygramma]|nr:hypothetical protein DFH06DRAFT_990079 [Mycena polygramma]